MGTAGTTFREFTIRPNEEAEVSAEPDGTIEILFRGASVTVLLTADEAANLSMNLMNAVQLVAVAQRAAVL